MKTLFLRALLLLAAAPASAAIYTVDTTTNNVALSACTAAPNDCSLRGAVDKAQSAASPGNDTIAFDIPVDDPNCDAATGVCTLTLDHPGCCALGLFGDGLGTQGLTFDGTTQPGASPNTLPAGQGTNAQIRIVLKAASPGIGIDSRINVTFRGLAFQLPVTIHPCCSGPTGGGRYEFFGNFFGLEADGVTPIPLSNHIGLGISTSFGNIAGARIGSADPADMNVFARWGEGMRLNGSNHRVQGNLIGTDRTGLASAGNLAGIRVCTCSDCQIGGAAPGEGNVISGNLRHAIAVDCGVDVAHPLRIRGNLIGVGVDGVTPLSNVREPDANAWSAIHSGSPGVVLGGSGPGEGNLIAFTGQDRAPSPNPPFPNRPSYGVMSGGWEILGNRFVGNRGMGIIGVNNPRRVNDAGDADGDIIDRRQNFPTISARSFPAPGQVQLTYHVDSAMVDPPGAGDARYPLRIEFFRADGPGADALLGSDTYAGAEAQQDKTITLTLPDGVALDTDDVIVAIATDEPAAPSAVGHSSVLTAYPAQIAFAAGSPTTTPAGMPVTVTAEVVATHGPFAPNGVVLFHYNVIGGVQCESALVPVPGMPNTSRASCSFTPVTVHGGGTLLALHPNTLSTFHTHPNGGDTQISTPFVVTAPGPEQIGFSRCRALALEGRDLVVSIIRPSGGVAQVSVDLQHETGSATPGADYTAPPAQTLSWGPGDSAPRQIAIPIPDDGVVEPAETFRLRLVNPINTAILPHALMEVSIHDANGRIFFDGFEGDCPP